MPASAPSGIRDPGSPWREGLIRRIRHVLGLTWLFGAMAALYWSQSSGMTALLTSMLVALPIVMFVLLQHRLSYATRAWSTVVPLVAFFGVSYVLIGFNAGAVAGAFVLILCALLLGRTATILVFGVLALILAGLTTAVWIGWWSGPPAVESDVSNPVIWLRTSLVTLIVLGGIASSVLFVVTAIETSLKRREQALRQLEQEGAQRREAEKARKDAESMIFQAQKLNSLGQLAAGVAHDINNMLLVVQGWTDILRHNCDEDVSRRGMDAIDQASHHCAELVQHLLTFSRKSVRNPAYLMVDALITDTMETLRRLLPATVAIEIEVQPKLAIFADETQFRQLIYNLVLNARDAMPDGGRLRVECRKQSAETIESEFPGLHSSDEWIVLSVADDGTGISPEIQSSIFEPFFSTKDPHKATGLGLATVFGIVTQAGGHIELSSEVGVGSRFTVYLPAVELRRPAEISTVASARARENTSLRVLVLEDDPLARDLIVFALQRAGHRVSAVEDGDSALREMGKTGRFDLLCADAVFPGPSLERVIAQFRQTSADGKILICSGYVEEELSIREIESGSYHFLAKPFTARMLADKIETLRAG